MAAGRDGHFQIVHPLICLIRCISNEAYRGRARESAPRPLRTVAVGRKVMKCRSQKCVKKAVIVCIFERV
jgi:hypothetical protein